MEKNDHVEQETTETPDVEETTEQEEETTTEDLAAQLGRLKRENTKLRKALLEEDEPEQPKVKVTTSDEVKFAKVLLEDKGFSDEQIKLAEQIAQVKGISLIQATKDEYFEFQNKKLEEKKVSENASTPTSRRGRVITRTDEDLKREALEGKDLSREDRMKLIKSKYGVK